MSPEEKGNRDEGEESRDETQEFELGDELVSEDDPEGEAEQHEDEDGEPGGLFDGHQHLEGDSEEFEAHEDDAGEEDEGPEAETSKEVEPPEDGSFDEDSELDQLISAETAEWDGLEAAEAEDDEAEEESEEEEEEEAEELSGQDEPTLVAAAGQRVGEAGSKLKEWRPGFPLWLRFVTASFVVVASITAATAASLILYLGGIAEALDPQGVLKDAEDHLTTVDGGAPQTILILGSDKDPELKDELKGFRGLSDTTMLLRLDPDREAIALFSLPRDLRAAIPGHGTDKLNAAYAYGGPELTLQTVEQLLSFGSEKFQVNHLVNVDFEGFARAVNALDCVYVDVDRRYFNKNTPGADATNYEEIDLQPGYQALCGFDALDYARYRHTDNDVVRAARQQEFLREARQKIPAERLFADRKELISIFTEHTTSDINDPQTMLQVLKLFLEARDSPIKQVKFEGTLGPSFVDATPAQLQRAVREFLGFRATRGQAGQTALPDEPVEPQRAPDQVPVVPAEGGGKGKRKAAQPPSSGGGEEVGLTPTQYGQELAKGVRARLANLTVYYPTVLESGSDYDQKPRVYKVNGTGQGAPPQGGRAAYKWVFSRPALGEYYGFMGTRWKDPPILEGPDETKQIGDREYRLYYDGDRLRMVAWEDDLGSYWLTNTLIESVSSREMLRIARGMRDLPRGGG